MMIQCHVCINDSMILLLLTSSRLLVMSLDLSMRDSTESLFIAHSLHTKDSKILQHQQQGDEVLEHRVNSWLPLASPTGYSS